MNPVVTSTALHHLAVIIIVLVALEADGTVVALEEKDAFRRHETLLDEQCRYIIMEGNSCFYSSPISNSLEQSWQSPFSWFQSMSQLLPGVTPQLLHLMQVTQTCRSRQVSATSRECLQ